MAGTTLSHLLGTMDLTGLNENFKLRHYPGFGMSTTPG